MRGDPGWKRCRSGTLVTVYWEPGGKDWWNRWVGADWRMARDALSTNHVARLLMSRWQNPTHFHRTIISQRLNMHIPSDIIAWCSNATDQSEQRVVTHNITSAGIWQSDYHRVGWWAGGRKAAYPQAGITKFSRYSPSTLFYLCKISWPNLDRNITSKLRSRVPYQKLYFRRGDAALKKEIRWWFQLTANQLCECILTMDNVHCIYLRVILSVKSSPKPATNVDWISVPFPWIPANITSKLIINLTFMPVKHTW